MIIIATALTLAAIYAITPKPQPVKIRVKTRR